MNKWDIDKIPYKEKKEFVLKSCLLYGKMLKQKQHMNRYDKEAKWYNLDGVSMFENILDLLTQNENLIIKNDFIKNIEYTNLYLDHWCKTTYYKYKNDAINKFIYLLFF